MENTPEYKKLNAATAEDQAVYVAISNQYWGLKANCKSCANRGKIDGLSQETHCDHCIFQEQWRTNHYTPL